MRVGSVIQSRFVRHLLFWMMFYALYINLGMAAYSSWTAVISIYLGKIAIQALAAYVLVYLLIPALLNRKMYLLFALALLTWTYAVYALLVISRGVYLEPIFIEFFRNSERHMPILQRPVRDRLFSIIAYLDALPWLFTPAAFMGLIKFYQTQLRLHKIAEEKKSMELQILKNQLNPHFLFNTLNNVYTLALKKDDRAPDAIARLSEILDFILYRCQGDLINLKDAVSLLENFIALENLRYGEKRLRVIFSKDHDDNYRVPPLILLTLLENAFKHGVSNETGKAYINISLSAKNKRISFKIENSKPGTTVINCKEANNIGLKNISRQLALLYPSLHELNVADDKNSFVVNLVLHEY